MPVAIKKPVEETPLEEEEREEPVAHTEEEKRKELAVEGEKLCFELPESLMAVVKIVQQFSDDREVVETLIQVFRKKVRHENVPEELKILAKLLQ